MQLLRLLTTAHRRIVSQIRDYLWRLPVLKDPQPFRRRQSYSPRLTGVEKARSTVDVDSEIKYKHTLLEKHRRLLSTAVKIKKKMFRTETKLEPIPMDLVSVKIYRQDCLDEVTSGCRLQDSAQ